ncbi:MAG TPA: NAD(P)-binding domain-containing protein, partial [Gemmatimonadales bacterium]|nr:NAD(P)-binding domain-containing protein [Gemmatimonadales bacterium]
MKQHASRAIGLIGPGRAGAGLALALTQAGYTVCLHGRRKKNLPKPLTLTVGDGTKPPQWIGDIEIVVLAVRDDAITPLAASLARAGVITERHVVLHLSGVQG